jgi:hypothetical protein
VTKKKSRRSQTRRAEREGRPVAQQELRRATVSPAVLVGGLLAVLVLLGGVLIAMLRSPPASSALPATPNSPSGEQGYTPFPTLEQMVAEATGAATPTPLPVMASGPAEPEQVQRISVADAKALVDRGEAVLYDTRLPESFMEKHAAGAVSFPEASLDMLAPTLPSDKALVFYCT